MVEIEATRLPGVGMRHDLVTEAGRRLAVITRHSGRRELLLYDEADPDSARVVVQLSEDERTALVDLLGGAHVTATLGELQQQVQGLAIDWLPIARDWFADGHTIAETALRRRTGVSIVAILRDGQTIPSPGPDATLRAADTIVVVGTPEGIEQASVVLQAG